MIDDSVANNLGPKVGGKRTVSSHLKQFLQDILLGKFNNAREAKEYYAKNIYYKYEKKIRDLNTNAAKEMVDVYDQVKTIFIKPSIATDETDYETDEAKDDETDDETDEQPDTADMPKLESEESAAQKRENEGQGLRISTPGQMISRLPISLAQLEARNNSQKLKN